VCSVVTDCINNVVMLDILAVKLSLSTVNKVAVTTLRCNLLQLKRRRNASAAGAPPRTPLGELTVLPRPPSWKRQWKGSEGRMGISEQGRKGEGKRGEGPPAKN